MKVVISRVKAVLSLAPVKALLKKEARPIKKVLAGAIASAVVFLAHKAHIHIPVKQVDDLASYFAGSVVAYLVKG